MRTNKPIAPLNAELIHDFDFGTWMLYKVTDERYKLIAGWPVRGSANYVLKITDGVIAPTLDKWKLQQSRPDLCAKLEAYLLPLHLPKPKAKAKSTKPRHWAGKPLSGTPQHQFEVGCNHCGEIEVWHLGLKNKTDDYLNYKLWADFYACHKANYHIACRKQAYDGEHRIIQPRKRKDARLLQEHRPELYAMLEKHLNEYCKRRY